jgi:hypothetical protein
MLSSIPASSDTGAAENALLNIEHGKKRKKEKKKKEKKLKERSPFLMLKLLWLNTQKFINVKMLIVNLCLVQDLKSV